MKFNELSDEIIDRALNVRLLLMDCDGVLTDGRLYFTSAGESMKVFHVRDGQGLALWHSKGLKSGIITGRGSGDVLHLRANELGIEHVRTNSTDKIADFKQIAELTGVSASETAFIGDDVGDIDLLKLVGLPATVADASDAVLPHIKYQTANLGGHGAVRELIDMILHVKSSAGR